MTMKVISFLVALIMIPLVPVFAQSLSTTGVVDKLATGSAQFILAAFCVVELAIIIKGSSKLFSMYRKDMREANEKHELYMQDQARMLQGLLADNSAALTKQHEASDNMAGALTDLTNEMTITRAIRTGSVKVKDLPPSG